MIQQETSHRDQVFTDLQVTHALLEAQAESVVRNWNFSQKPFGKAAVRRYRQVAKDQQVALLARAERPPDEGPFDTRPPDQRDQVIREHKWLLKNAFKEVAESWESFAKLPEASLDDGATQPRVFLLVDKFLAVTEERWTRETWAVYLRAVERHEPLMVREIWSFVAALKLLLLQRFCHYSKLPSETNQQQNAGSALQHMQYCIQSLERLGEVEWSRFLEPMIPFDRILMQDPAGAYAGMEVPSRLIYHGKVEQLARRSDMSEVQVAQTAVVLAQEAKGRSGTNLRETHVGYYLMDDGVEQLSHRVGHHPGISERMRTSLRRLADEFYIGGIEVVTGLLIFAILVPHISVHSSMTADLFALILMIIPASQSAVDLLNNLVSRIFAAQALPKMDFSSGVPVEFSTLVVVPTLLLNEKQIRTLVEDVEIRYLANQDHNIHFALLTDLADSVKRPSPNDSSPLVDLAVKLIDELNERYRPGGRGTIFLLHRHRIFNQRQQVWMGWERKRGKLLDLNKLICGEEDAFPVKSRVLPDIKSIRYVITLDSDTQLPRGAAHRLIGTMAHPLNQPVIDTHSRIVHKGYGILQPRVDISVHSANHSRLAALQSGETGVDPYSRAVSDVYQDLYGEAIFTGKGLYDVAVLHAVLNKRFPRNSLLSHDLIEGAYARVGLVSDVEVVDDYPSHYSAWSRRKHRWVRGDWQTIQWLFNRVPNEQGKRIKNPISLTSKWRILDNLRRSLVEIATLALLLAGWIGLPGGALYWTTATLSLLFLPVYVQLAFSLLPALFAFNLRSARKVVANCVDEHGRVLLSVIFLPSQVMITLDAIFRANFRSFVSGQRLLEWETAAEAESKSGGTPVDRYLRVMPVFAALLAVALYFHNSHNLLIASPILLLWALTNPFVVWLNAKPIQKEYQPEPDQVIFLHNVALRTWRYFAEFSTPENHWLIPDNVQEGEMRRAERVSPTNIGFLLNARQAALEFGYLTLGEFTRATTQTLTSIEQMPKHRGHLFNWHNTRTLETMRPYFVTTVDSGNLVGSLISLRMGCHELLDRPMLDKDQLSGLRDHLEVLGSLGVAWPGRIINLEHNDSDANWIDTLLRLGTSLQLKLEPTSDAEARWWASQTERRVEAIREYVEQYLPWQMPDYDQIRQTVLRDLAAKMLQVTPHTAQSLFDEIRQRLQTTILAADTDGLSKQLYQQLLDAMAAAQPRLDALVAELQQIDELSRRLVQEMDFTFLQNPERELMSIGYLQGEEKPALSCFDLLASEARMAAFVAIAKGDVPQQTWFRMGRTHVTAAGKRLMISWTGTMFEYLMPSLWMQSDPNTLIYRSIMAIVQVETWFAKKYRIPWGVSESGYSDTDVEGNYLYHAFGIPEIALKYGAEAGPVISPYSSCLALEVDPAAALSNLKSLQKLGWLGSYGFYEAGDYRVSSASRRQPTCTLVRSWMAHHQGMSLLAICNLLRGRVFQRWFHKSPMVQSTERLLHERPQLQAEG
jgi:cyclic beta-1,2-glucan synthetase